MQEQTIPDEKIKSIHQDAEKWMLTKALHMRSTTMQRFYIEGRYAEYLLSLEREKKHAQLFALWIRAKGYYVPNSNFPIVWCNGPKNDWPQICYSDDQLYDLFLQSKNK